MEKQGFDTNKSGNIGREIEKKNFCKMYAEAFSMKKEVKANRMQYKNPNPRHRAPQGDADELFQFCVNNVEHEEDVILSRNLRNILGDDQRCLHVRYMQAYRVKVLLIVLHQAKAFVKRLIKVLNSAVKDYSIAEMQVRRYGNSKEQRQRHNEYFAHRALTRALRRRNLGQKVTFLYTKYRA